jgi:predicted S18 family serine protease
MGPQAFFQALTHIAAIASAIAIVWVFLWIRRNGEKIRRSEEIRERSQLVLDLPENRYMSLKIPTNLVEKRNTIFNMLRRARLYYSSGDERAALFTLHNAVASTLSILCEAEGIQSTWKPLRGPPKPILAIMRSIPYGP